MKQALIFVPFFFLIALVAIGALFYTNTDDRTGCTGAECEQLSDTQYIDMVLEARTE